MLITRYFTKKIDFVALSKVVQNSILRIYTKFRFDPDVTQSADMRGRDRQKSPGTVKMYNTENNCT